MQNPQMKIWNHSAIDNENKDFNLMILQPYGKIVVETKCCCKQKEASKIKV